MFEKRELKEQQEEMWLRPTELPKATPNTFYRKVNETLAKIGFSKEVWEICKSAYADASLGGRTGIDPVVYLKMLMVGFFENIGSQRGLAARCADSLSIRGFLGYSLSEATPNHSSMTVIRDRLSLEQLEAIHRVLLKALKAHGLLKGRKLGIDSSVIEANASLRGLEHRNTEQSYWDYLKQLAEDAGIDPQDVKAVKRFDKKRPGRKTSNQEWQNPHDPEAKVGRTKDGACDMIYKPEHISDLESGAIVQVEVRHGDEADNDSTLCERVMSAVGSLSEVMPEVPLEKLGSELCADEGYFALGPIAELQACGVRTIISDPQASVRKKEKLSKEERSALWRARRATKSESGKALLRRRGEHLERGFCHVLDHGGLRRTTLRGKEKLTKRHWVGALTHNLSLLMRHLIGVGTPKQALAKGRSGVFGAIWLLWRRLLSPHTASLGAFADFALTLRFQTMPLPFAGSATRFSTGC